VTPGQPTSLGHYEFIFIQDSSTRGSRVRLLLQAVGCCVQTRVPTSRQVPQEPSDGRLAKFCADPSEPSWDPQDKASPIATRQSLTAKRLFCGPPSTTHSEVRLLALIATSTRANPWYMRVSAAPTGITVGLTAEAAWT
jgi:hypothetical protein